jgi:hypothetical protein
MNAAFNWSASLAGRTWAAGRARTIVLFLRVRKLLQDALGVPQNHAASNLDRQSPDETGLSPSDLVPIFFILSAVLIS